MRLGATAILMLLALVRPALASDEDIAKAHFEIGLSYYDQGRFEPAAREFIEAYRLTPLPALLYNLGRTYERLGDPGRAVTYYRRYVAGELPEAERAKVEEAIRLLQPRITTVHLRSTVAGAQVTLDGEPLGVSPVEPFVVSAGAHELTAKHDGYLDKHLQIQARGGSELTVTLDPIAVVAPAPAHEAPKRRRWVGPVVGVAAALVVGGILAATLTVTLSKDYSAAGRDSCKGSCVLFDGAR